MFLTATQICRPSNEKQNVKQNDKSGNPAPPQPSKTGKTSKATKSTGTSHSIPHLLTATNLPSYGFINPIYISSSAPTPSGAKAPKRVATALFAETTQEPRKRTLRRLRLSPSAPEMLRMPTNQKQLREKEDVRSRKWKAMAIPQTKSESGKGRGIEWTFHTKDHRLIKRVWKGIPDCWRGAAWHAFMTASAKTRGVGQSDAELVTKYYVRNPP